MSTIFFMSLILIAEVFDKRTVKLGSETLVVEIADTDEKRAVGLMHRTELKDGRGMLFIFEGEAIRSFWMKNTFVPLSIGYFDKNKKLLSIHKMTPQKSILEANFQSYPSLQPAQYALEVPQGWFERNKIKKGEEFQFVK